MHKWHASVALALVGWTSFAVAQAQWTDLADDLSRSQLGSYELQKYGPPADRAARRNFAFPADADDGVYGVDVSHHNGDVEWRKLAEAKVGFVYIKATQGAQYKDPKFESNWSGASKAGLSRGAYHFFSAGITGTTQAKSYLALLELVGGLSGTDLTPVLDLEWDIDPTDSKKVDRWSKYSADEIADNALEWLKAVEAKTGRRPIIYTTSSWWKERMGPSERLKDYSHWIADYRLSSFSAQAPISVKRHSHRIWQFTDIGRVGDLKRKFDVNKLVGLDLAMLIGK